MSEINDTLPEDKTPSDNSLHDQLAVADMYQNWFLDYASYVILERAVPNIEDGLKPVQRRILHALKEMDDGRFNKVANVIGSTMQYHPHGDASINEALVNMGQKELVFDTQGSWGDIRTGDGAAAARYIEVRLSKFGNEVLFNADTTEWQMSYDGRKREPVTLPVKFPLLLAMGVEGIAVGLSTKIMPHNFVELLEASIAILKGQPFSLYPDFPTGGLIDVTNYNDGLRGGKVRVRAKIEEMDKKTLVIREIPFSTTTSSIKDSIIKASEEGKIKIKKPEKGMQAVEDLTAKDVEIVIHLAPGVSPDITIDALYAFTECEVSISPNACVIVDDKPQFVTVSHILKTCNDQTVHLLKRELEIRRFELKEKLLYSSLEKIFIENRIYRDIEECETFEAVIQTIDAGLTPFKADFYRDIVEEDILRLTEIRIKRISKFDAFKADEAMRKLEAELAEVEDDLAHLTRYAINYYKDLLKKYGKGRERRTEIRSFNTIAATVVAAANQKLYVNREEGFIGYGLKKDEYVMDCSDIDDIIVFRRDGKYKIVRVSDKVFVGKDIIYVAVFKKNDERKVYNVTYLDGKSGVSYAKRFAVTGITRDKDYDVTLGTNKSKITYFSANDNGEAEVITVNLTAQSTARIKVFDFNFSQLAIKNRSAMGNVLTKYPVRKIAFKSAGASTLGGVDLWYDGVLGRLNRDERGRYLGNFDNGDMILVLYKDGMYELTGYDLTNRYEPKDLIHLEKFVPERPISVVYFEAQQKNYFAKRFKIETTTLDKKFSFIGDVKGSKLVFASTDAHPRMEAVVEKSKTETQKEVVALDAFVDVRGWKALGNRVSPLKVREIRQIESLPEVKNEPVSGEKLSEEVSEPGEENEGTTSTDETGQLGLF
ncbi:MAG: DNA gyrase/topoisomerase IV subunit A [Spirosomataceae bacterium]